MPEIPQIKPYTMPTFNQIPENVANWKIDPKRVVLLVHDMQRFFIERIPLTPRADLIKHIALLHEWCVTHSIPVAYTAQPGDMTEKQRGLLKSFWGSGMKADPSDRQIVDELTPASEDWLFTKWRYSAFYNSNLLQKMRESDRDQLIICGVYAHIGVLITSIEAFSNDIQTFLVADAIADFSQVDHLMALNYAAQCCAQITLTHKILE